MSRYFEFMPRNFLFFLLFIIIYSYLLFNFAKQCFTQDEDTKIVKNMIIKYDDASLKTINNDLSSRLHGAYQIIGRLNCKLNDNITSSGGWCSTASNTEHRADEKFASGLSNFLKNKHVASFGDGSGYYKSKLLQLNQILSYDAFDGAPFVEEATKGLVKFLDLSLPIYHLSVYDWVLSIEVAEHIPKEFENIYLDNLARYARYGIIISWAAEGQDGFSHINGKNFPYVKSVIEARNFTHDVESSKLLQASAEFWWLKNNLNVFRRKY
jgi:hypothetical protein